MRAHAATITKMVADARAREIEEKKLEAQAAVLDAVADAPFPEAEPEEACGRAMMAYAAPPGCDRDSVGGKGGRSMRMMKKAGGPPRRGAPPPQPYAAEAPASNNAVPPAPTRPQQAEDAVEPVAGFDVTALPRRLDAAFEKLDSAACLRPTTINAANPWRVTSQKGLLSATKEKTLGTDCLASEKRKAFDLLDALTRSGAIPLLSTQLHVIVAATHAFDHDVAHQVVADNVNPIVKAERSSLLVASTLFGVSARALVEPSRVANLRTAHGTALLNGPDNG